MWIQPQRESLVSVDNEEEPSDFKMINMTSTDTATESGTHRAERQVVQTDMTSYDDIDETPTNQGI